jgi:hypothetical protein
MRDVIAYNPTNKKKLPPNQKKKNRSTDPMEAILQLSKTLTTEK